MIGLKTARGWLDLAPGTIGIEIGNPFFRYDAVPGVTTYPFNLPLTPGNRRLLNVPHVRALQGEAVAPEPVEFYLDGVLWRVGSLLYQDWQPDKNTYTYQFAAGADDLQARIDGVTLASLDLGTVPLIDSPLQPDYALRKVYNPDFYGDKYPGFSGYLNDGRELTPQPRLVPLLRRVLQQFGYSLSGEWLLRPAVQQLMVYSDRAAEDDGGRLASLALSQHVPASLTVPEALVALQSYLALGYNFDPVRREMRIIPLRDVVEDDAYLVRQAGALTRALPAGYQGYTLSLGLESDDELAKTMDTNWASLVLDAGKTEVRTEAGTLQSINGVPSIRTRGATPRFDLGDDSRCGLRLLFDRPDQLAGDLVLRWAGDNGLYAQCHKPWLDFLKTAGTEERTMPFRVADLLALNPARKEMVGPRKYLWEKISVTVSTSTRLESARFTYRNIRR
ncbi:hypothetical protein [Hymenobacter crusticola]|uniref:Uncharacterized protein n=1 Tax=Hymenobacter crusticola TaxID=1770526 RepID=A0A243W9C2_9BACT|nr:hypothetical protein [Hymenobacter crusticola]OUJ71987.1 hypothetical protein BXP70_20465 [Hymenobacter crusticola]